MLTALPRHLSWIWECIAAGNGRGREEGGRIIRGGGRRQERRRCKGRETREIGKGNRRGISRIAVLPF